jgi:outer membrane protein OmpA-like peptidoglycan-associated protein
MIRLSHQDSNFVPPCGAGSAKHAYDTTISIYFNFGKDIFEKEELQRVGSKLNQIKFRVKEHFGFADSVSIKEDNMMLLVRRSSRIEDYLAKNYTIPRGSPVNNKGEGSPASPTNNTLNRRIEIVIAIDQKFTQLPERQYLQ